MEGGSNEQWGENWVEDFKSGAGSKKVLHPGPGARSEVVLQVSVSVELWLGGVLGFCG